MPFRLSGDGLQDGGKLPEAQVNDQMGYSGGNRSPHLRWEGAPEGTRSFAVTMYDPDAPTGSGWWHWVVIDLPASVTELSEGAGSAGGTLPVPALNTRTDFGSAGYGALHHRATKRTVM
jgi:Raf kinase inhibitor-like YbhB/YbcL family protein